jgi:hypothetical protein
MSFSRLGEAQADRADRRQYRLMRHQLGVGGDNCRFGFFDARVIINGQARASVTVV